MFKGFRINKRKKLAEQKILEILKKDSMSEIEIALALSEMDFSITRSTLLDILLDLRGRGWVKLVFTNWPPERQPRFEEKDLRTILSDNFLHESIADTDERFSHIWGLKHR